MSEFDQLIEAHYKPLYRFAYSLSKSPDLASDLVQQTYAIWASKGSQLKDRTKAKTWLFTTLYREYLKISRISKRFLNEDTSNLEFTLPSAENEGPRRLDTQRALHALSQLEDIFRAPLTLFFLKQHSYKEISSILDIPIGTVMSRISRGKEILKRDFFEKNVEENKIVNFKKNA